MNAPRFSALKMPFVKGAVGAIHAALHVWHTTNQTLACSAIPTSVRATINATSFAAVIHALLVVRMNATRSFAPQTRPAWSTAEVILAARAVSPRPSTQVGSAIKLAVLKTAATTYVVIRPAIRTCVRRPSAIRCAHWLLIRRSATVVTVLVRGLARRPVIPICALMPTAIPDAPAYSIRSAAPAVTIPAHLDASPPSAIPIFAPRMCAATRFAAAPLAVTATAVDIVIRLARPIYIVTRNAVATPASREASSALVSAPPAFAQRTQGATSSAAVIPPTPSAARPVAAIHATATAAARTAARSALQGARNMTPASAETLIHASVIPAARAAILVAATTPICPTATKMESTICAMSRVSINGRAKSSGSARSTPIPPGLLLKPWVLPTPRTTVTAQRHGRLAQ